MGDQNELIGQAKGVHFAFLAPNQAAVDAWHAKCMALGAQDNGAHQDLVLNITLDIMVRLLWTQAAGELKPVFTIIRINQCPILLQSKIH